MSARITETTPPAPSGPFVWGDRSALGASPQIEQDCQYEESRGPEALSVALWLAIGMVFLIAGAMSCGCGS